LTFIFLETYNEQKRKKTEERVIHYDADIVVVGAGVAGLAAATASARAGGRTIVLEASAEIAPKVKGEVIKQNNHIIERILRRPLPDSMINGVSRRRRIFSPSCKNQFVVTKQEASLIIEYRPLVQAIARACVQSGVKIMLNTEVTRLIIDEREQTLGVECKDSGSISSIRCKAVIAADGATSALRRQMNFPTPAICPAYKVIVEGADIPDEDMLQFFLLNEPAGALWMFPKGGSSAECGITYWDTSPEVHQSDMQAAWERHRLEHPILRERLRNASPVLTSRDSLIFGGVLQDFARPGLVLVGDAAGQVGASGASGILSSLNMGYEAGSFLGAYAAGHQASADMPVMQRCMELMKSTDTWRMLEAEEKSGAMTRHFLFNILKTNEEIDNAWDAIAEMAKGQ
jgi:flavin-dependent dehydrogenase